MRGTHIIIAIAGAALLGNASLARADIAPDEPDVPIQTLQRLLCEREKEGDSCGEGAKGEPLVCGVAACDRAPCLLCMRATVPSRDPPAAMRSMRLPNETPVLVDADPTVIRMKRTWQAGGMSLLVGTVALLASRSRRWARRGGAALAVAGLVAAIVGWVGQGAAAEAYLRRREEARVEVVLIPVGAELPLKHQLAVIRSEEGEHVEQLKRLLYEKNRDWRPAPTVE